MIMDRFSQRERRVLAVGLLAALLIVVFFGVVGPYISQYQLYRSTIDDQLFRLDRLQRAAGQLPALRNETRSLRELVRSQQLLLDQDTPALAAAHIQQMIVQMVADKGGEIRSVQAGRTIGERGFVRVSVRIRMSADSMIMADLFSTIESGKPLMFVDEVTATAVRQRARRGASRPESGRVELEFDVYAYMAETSG